MRSSFLITLGIFVLAVLLLNAFVANPSFSTPGEQADFEIQSRQPELAEKTLFLILRQDSLNITNNYRYISVHFDIPEKRQRGKNDYVYRDDNTIRNYYDSFTKSANSSVSDIGYYCNGLIQAYLENFSAALFEFHQIKNPSLPYFNNSIGNVYKHLGNYKEAEFHFRKEIELKGNLAGVYSNLAELLFEKRDKQQLDSLLKNKEAEKYFPSGIKKNIYFTRFQFFQYAVVLFSRTFSGFNIWGFFAAFLIMGSWIMYLRKLDVFEIEKWKNIIVTVGLGMLFCFLVDPLSDFNNLVFRFKLTGGIVNDFLYCVIGIGAIEEFVKILPLLLLLKYTKVVNEPFDYILYASLSALGFAFVENLIYFGNSNLQIIHGRALTAVISHMFNSSIIGYGIMLNRFKRRKNPYLNFLFFLALAALSHGFYDFWLINKSVRDMSIITILFLLMSIYIWNSFKNNALNNSNFFDKDKTVNIENLHDYLIYSLAGVLLFEYIALSFKFGPGVANKSLLSSMYGGTYLIIFLSSNLSKVNLIKGDWEPIRYWGNNDKIDYNKIVGMEFKLNLLTSNSYAEDYLPNSGHIAERLTVSKEPDWYLIKLDAPKGDSSHLKDSVIVRTKNKAEQIEKGHKRYIAFYLIPVETKPDKEGPMRTDLKFCGWATIE